METEMRHEARQVPSWLISDVRQKMTASDRQALPRWLCVWWWIAIVFCAPLYLRLLWEETLLTWKQGRQMIGFTVAHAHPELLLSGVLGYLLILVWLVTALVFLAKRRKRPSTSAVVYLSIPVVAIAIDFVPYDFWARLGGVQ